MWAQIINIITGLFLMVAPGIWQWNKAAAHNNFIVAPLVVTIAIVALWEVNRNARWLNIPAGLWLLVAPFVLDYSSDASVINMACGVLVVGLSLVKGKVKGQYGGGWRSLLQDNPLHMQAVKKT